MAKQDHTDTSNVAVFPNRSAIKEEAGLWIVRMDEGELDAAEVEELRQWIRQSDFHRDYLLKLAANWDSMAVLEALADMFPLPEREPQRARGSSRLTGWLSDKIRMPVVAAAGTGALAVALLLMFAPMLDTGGARELTTGVGERARYTLQDGTTVSLNTDTRLKVDYAGAHRAVYLERGEANFEVAHNPEQPFVVYAGNGLVWAVGTAFNVRYVGDTVDVTVTEGRVKVVSDTRGRTARGELSTAISDERQEALIGAGQSLRYAQVIESLEPIQEEESVRKLAWRQGSLIFKGETLQEAVAEISRYTDKELIITDPSLAELRVGGHYKTDDINLLLDALGQGLDIDIRYASDDRVLLSAQQSGAH